MQPYPKVKKIDENDKKSTKNQKIQKSSTAACYSI